MSNNPNDSSEQPLVGHLLELRDRLLRMLIVTLAIFAGLFYFSNNIYEFVSAPLEALLPENSSMIATEVASPFFAPFKLTLIVSLFLAMPYILYQVWRFVAPGLYENEKRLATPLLFSSIMLFYAGVAFAYYVVFPLLFGFFTSVGPENVAVMTDISAYLNFVLKIFFAFGVAFEIPIATIILITAGVTTAENLAKKRPYIVVGCFVVGMLLTPPDIISQALLAVPMWLLFELGVFFGRWVRQRPENQEPEDG